MPKQPTKKSQDGRRPICGKCYKPMTQHQDWVKGGWDWICEGCGRREKGPDEQTLPTR